MKIVSTAPIPPLAHAILAPIGEVELAENGDQLADAEILIVRGGRVDATMIDGATQLRVIARTGAGYDSVDVEAATRRGIPVVYAPDAGSVPVAEGAFALMLAAAKRLGELGAMVRHGDWNARYDIQAVDLRGGVLGIVGFGRIGREMGRLGRAFGMSVLAHDPVISPNADDVRAVTLKELVNGSDVISLHCALNDQTRGMVNGALLSHARPGAILVNVARGAIVESDEVLLEALEEGWLSAVGLDVFSNEPPDPAHPLLAHPRAVCTPHSVGLTPRWTEGVFRALAEAIIELLHGNQPDNLVNPEVSPLVAADGRRPA